MKKFLFAIICTLLPLAAWSQLGPQPYAILSDSNSVLTFYYDELYEARRGAMYVGQFWDEEERQWHNQRTSIISVVFDESFAQYTSLTSTAFWFLECSNLETIVGLSYLNTGNVESMDAMFGGCSRLETISLENFNTEKVEDMAAMFAGCTNLRHLNLSSFNTSRVKSMMGMFYQCSSLTTIYVSSGWTTASVTESNDMFSGCTSLVGGNGTTFNSNHTDASFAHIDSENDPGYLTGATSGDEPYWQELQYTIEYGTEVMMRARNSSSVDPWMVEELEMFLERADEMYNERTASEQEVRHMIEELNWIIREVEEAMNRPVDSNPEPYAVLSDNNTVLTFYYDGDKEARGGMSVGPFGGISEVSWSDARQTITLVVFDPSFANCSSISSTAYWFHECKNLSQITGLGYFNTANVTNMRFMFSRCGSLTSLDMTHFNTANVTDMGFMFDGCYGLTNLNVSNFNTDNVKDMQLMFSSCSSLTSLDVSNFYTTNVIDMGYMFSGCSSLTSLDVSNFNTTNVTSMSSMFFDCSNLTSLDVSHFITTNVRNMSWMFSGCSSLTSLDVSNFNTANVIDMKYMFVTCSDLTSLDVSNFNTANVTDVSCMFSHCSGLTSLDVSHFNTANVTTMDGMFIGCSGLTSLDVSHFNTANVTNMEGMFVGCSGLTSLDVSHFNTANVTNMEGMFNECSRLATIYAGDNWSTTNVTNSEKMFYGCTNLVGGRGTTYDANHTDVSYAHIDGGTANPGYLTDINGSGSSDLDQRRAELLDMIEQLVQQIDVCAYELSRKDPQRTSDLWAFLANIEESIYDVRDRTERAESDAELDECEERIRQIREEIDYLYMRIAEYAVGDASFDGLTARVSGSATLDDAFESVGGRAVAAQTIAAIVWNADDALTADMLTGINNPNLLVYVTEASKAPSGVQNVVINGTAAEIVLTDASGNNNFYCPQSFTALSISYTRNFSQTTQIDVCQGWETISLPFAVQSIRHQTHGALTPFGGGNNGYPFWLRQLSSSGLSRATAIEANRPYLICMPNNTVYPSVYNQAGNITFSATNVTVPITSEQTASGAGVTLRPAFQQVAQSNSVYALNVGEARGSNPEGSVFEQNYRAIRPFQAYTTHSSGTRFITLQSLGLGGDDTTGIEAIDTEEADDGNATWHTLDGRRLEGKPTKKGVYIKDGRKYIIK